MKNLNAKNLKETLWETLNAVKKGEIQPAEADSIATQSREILRTVNVQLKITSQSKRNVSTELIDFSEKQD
jgi:hypothetical protein